MSVYVQYGLSVRMAEDGFYGSITRLSDNVVVYESIRFDEEGDAQYDVQHVFNQRFKNE